MDGDSKRQNKNKKKIGYGMSNHGNILQSPWIRCNVRNDNELDRVLLDYGFNFLFPFGLFLWIIFLVISNI